MIYIQDNFLPEEDFYQLQWYCDKEEFKAVKSGEKEFSVIDVPEVLNQALQIEGYTMIFSFIRRAYKGFDNDLRVHADNIINGSKTSLAAVLYINHPFGVTENGTAFYEHHKYGRELPKDISDQEFDRLLTDDSNDHTKWTMKSFISSEPNRLLIYNSNYFHAKWPAEIEDGTRIVLAAFYQECFTINP